MSEIRYTGGRRGGRRKIKRSILPKFFLILVVIVIIGAAGAGIFAAVHFGIGQAEHDVALGEFNTSEETTEEGSVLTEESTEEAYGEQTEKGEESYDEKRIDEILNSMSLEEKVCQMFFITPEALTGVDVATAAGNMTGSALEEYPVGGLIYFGQNIETEAGFKEMLKNTKEMGEEICKAPLFLATDEEGGSVARLGSSEAVNVPKVSDMCDIKTEDDAYGAGRTIGKYLREYGFNMDFAPVADVLTNDKNEVVKKRSFGSDPQVVSDLSLKAAEGLNDEGILACYKHFPGHGGTTEDSHEGMAVTNKTYDDLSTIELKPFANAIEHNADFIMAGHISLPKILKDNKPASLSDVIITDLLINKLGFKGIVITDSLSMEAVTRLGTADVIAKEAVNAGADMLLMPQDFKTAYNGLLDAVKTGDISEERINKSVSKILRVKQKLN